MKPGKSDCEDCGSMLLPASEPIDQNNGRSNGMDGNTGDTHSCLQTVRLCVRQNAHHVKEQEDMIKSQSILIGKLIRELEEVKERLKVQEKESGRLKDQVEKVMLNQASLSVEPEHKSLIHRLKSDEFITSEKVHQIMLSVDFKDFSQDSVTPNKRFVCSILDPGCERMDSCRLCLSFARKQHNMKSGDMCSRFTASCVVQRLNSSLFTCISVSPLLFPCFVVFVLFFPALTGI